MSRFLSRHNVLHVGSIEVVQIFSRVGVLVADAKAAFEASVAHGAVAVQPPTVLQDPAGGGQQIVAEVLLYGDCVLRFVSGSYQVNSLSTLHIS